MSKVAVFKQATNEQCSTEGCKDPVAHKGLSLCAACNSWRYVWATGRKTMPQVQKRVYQIHRLNTRTSDLPEWRRYAKKA